MKHHIVFKFIAILLCAASLMGAVGSGAGILVLMEANLYQKTAEQAYQDTLESYVESYANDMAVQYAAKELGGAGNALLDSYYGSGWYYDAFNMNRLGYVLSDAEGNVLAEQSLGDSYKAQYTYDFTIIGNYLKVLSEMTEEEYHGTVALPEGVTTRIGEDYVYNAIPEGGEDVYFIEVQHADGSGWGIGSPDESLGILFQHEDGTVEFLPTEDYGPMEDADPVSITFMTLDQQCIYEASSPNGVLDEYSWAENVGFTLRLRSLTEAVMTMDAIPMGGCAVTRVSVTYGDDFSESVGGAPDIGYLDYDEEGRVRFVPYDAGAFTYKDIPVTHIAFYAGENGLVYESRDPEGVGYFRYQGGELLFLAGRDSAPVEETLPDVTEVLAEEAAQFISDMVPVLPSDGAWVYDVEVWMPSNQTIMNVEGTRGPLGTVFINGDGYVVFRCDGLFGSAFETNYIRLYGENGNVLFEAYSADAEIGQGETVGQFAYDESGALIFTTDLSYGNVPVPASDVASAQEIPADEEPFWAEVQTNTHIFAEAGGSGDAVGAFSRGDIVHVLRTKDNWALTDQGWVSMEQLVPVEVPVPEEEAVPHETISFTMEPIEDTAVPEATEVTIEMETVPGETMVEATISPATEPVVAAEYFAGEADVYGYYDYVSGQRMYAEYTHEPMPAYTVQVQLAEGAFRYEHEWVLIRSIYALRGELPYILIGCLLLFAILAVYLCCAAGKKPGTKEIHAGGLNCIPLDIYACIAAGGVALLVVGGVEGTSLVLRYHTAEMGALLALLCAYAASLLVVAFCFACAAQFKTPHRYWWRHSLCGFCLRLAGKVCRWLLKFARWATEKCETWLWPAVVRLCRGIFKVVKMLLKIAGNWLLRLVEWLQRCGDWMGKKLNRFFSLLPLTWQWLLVGFGMFLLMAIVFATNGEEVLVVICIGICISIILYGAHCFGCLLEGVKRMSKGDLDEKVDGKLMTGSFREFAGELNSLADVAVVAAQKQLKSERMKTELITNVSHDIKTPLTSIINYVDLLQKPHTDAQQEQYLEVLDRQSQRLKKLIDDLMEMSKASTGNLTVDVTKVDAGEAVNQALGEFADKLDKAQLIPVFRQPEQQVLMMADGRLVWRVMSNLLSNAVKYALPGTRVYVDLQKLDSKVIISMKNISREELNVEADELLERFVRGDASRNTEGSGLGLNIAQSLMELQKGQLQILVDGDLFKVTLVFPGVE